MFVYAHMCTPCHITQLRSGANNSFFFTLNNSIFISKVGTPNIVRLGAIAPFV